MSKNLFIFCLIALVSVQLVHAGRAISRNSNRRNYYGSQAAPPVTQAPPQTPKEYLDSKSGISTFGIVSILFVVIVGCLAFYYGIMCYPFLCREEKKYRFMDVSSTLTTATSRSIQSMENYPVDSKH